MSYTGSAHVAAAMALGACSGHENRITCIDEGVICTRGLSASYSQNQTTYILAGDQSELSSQFYYSLK